MTDKTKLKLDPRSPQSLISKTRFELITSRTVEDCADYLLDSRGMKLTTGVIQHVEVVTVDERTIRFMLLMVGGFQQRVWAMGTLDTRYDGKTVIRGAAGEEYPLGLGIIGSLVALTMALLTSFASEALFALVIIFTALALMWLRSVETMKAEVQRMLFSLKA